jgi:hypothetical protein
LACCTFTSPHCTLANHSRPAAATRANRLHSIVLKRKGLCLRLAASNCTTGPLAVDLMILTDAITYSTAPHRAVGELRISASALVSPLLIAVAFLGFSAARCAVWNLTPNTSPRTGKHGWHCFVSALAPSDYCNLLAPPPYPSISIYSGHGTGPMSSAPQ